MGFQPIVSSAVREMDKKLFQEGKVGMRNEIIQIMKRRFHSRALGDILIGISYIS